MAIAKVECREMSDITEQPTTFIIGASPLAGGKVPIESFLPDEYQKAIISRSGLLELSRRGESALPASKEYGQVLKQIIDDPEFLPPFKARLLKVVNPREGWNYYNSTTPKHVERAPDYMMVTSSPQETVVSEPSNMLVRADQPNGHYSELLQAVFDGERIRLVEGRRFPHCEDPSFASDQEGNLYVGMVAVACQERNGSKSSSTQSQFYKVRSLHDLTEDRKPDFTVEEMKDVRLVFKRNGRVGVYIRPQFEQLQKREEALKRMLLDKAQDEGSKAKLQARFNEQAEIDQAIFGRGKIGYIEMEKDQLLRLQEAVGQVIRLFREIAHLNQDRLSQLATIGCNDSHELSQKAACERLLGDKDLLFRRAEMFLDQTAEEDWTKADWTGANWVEELSDGSHRVVGHKAGLKRDEKGQVIKYNGEDARRYAGWEFKHNPATSIHTLGSITRIKEMFPEARRDPEGTSRNKALTQVVFPAGEVQNPDGTVSEFFGAGDAGIGEIIRRGVTGSLDPFPSRNNASSGGESFPLKTWLKDDHIRERSPV